MKSIIFTTLLLMLSLSTTSVAQFEGQIRMNLYGTDEQGNRSVSNIDLFATEDRILIRGAESLNVNEMLEAKGLLIRNDTRDFVVMMEGNKALQFTKTDLESTFRMFANMGDNQNTTDSKDAEPNVSYRYTNEVRTINGYEATELHVESEDNNGYLSIWLTPDIKLNWGMLAEPWLNVPKSMRSTADRLSQEFKSSNFPVLIEAYDAEKDQKQVIAEIATINPSSVAKAMVQVPSGTTLMGLNELMFMMMMGN